MNTTGTLTQKHKRVVSLTDAAARKVGFGSTLTDQERVDVISALKELVEAYEQVGSEVEGALTDARTFVDVPEGSTLAQTIGDLRVRIDNTAKAEHKAKQLAADVRFKNGGA
jgi:hypothetical protein